MLPHYLLPDKEAVFKPEPMENYLEPGKKVFFLNSAYRLFILNAITSLVDRYIKGKKQETIIDYGCGQMPYRQFFEPHFAKYYGADLPGNQDAELHLSEEGDIPLDDETADVVLSSQVLEHVPDPHAYIGECFRVLKKDGLLILSTHGIYNWHPSPVDYHRWTWQGLEYELTKYDFEMVEILPVGGPLAISVNMWMRFFNDVFPKVRKLRPAFLAVIYLVGNLLMRVLEAITPRRAKYYNSYIFFCVVRKR